MHELFLEVLSKLQKVTVSFNLFVHPHGTTQVPLDEFSWNFIFVCF